ncbi:MAG: aspartate--tRNA(Asn) ligase [Thermoplasmataceae archaeon]
MHRHLIGNLVKEGDGAEVELYGWLQDVRILKNVSFLILRDHTGTVQVTIKKGMIPRQEEILSLNRESVIKVSGKVSLNKGAKSGVEIYPTGVEVLNRSGAPLPAGVFDPVEVDFETRLNNRFLDLRKPDRNIIFRVESALLWGMRKYLMAQGFVEVHTPKIVASATEGGAELFQVKYFEKDVFLNQSPQLYKEILMSAGMDRVFEVGPAFRAEEHNTPRHLNEFTSVDIEMSFADHNDAMSMLENAVKSGVEEALSSYGGEISKMNPNLAVPEVPFPRITYRECLKILKEKGMDPAFGEDLNTDQLREIGRMFKGFYFITEWPSSLRPFYTMPKPGDAEVTNSYDLQYNEKEITSGAQRVHDPEMLEKRFREKKLKPEDFEFYIKAFRYGMPPHAGWGLGLERLTMILLGLQNIREATLFPRDRTRVVP